jgi:hypothetical protein
MAVYARRILTATAQLYCGYLLFDQALIAKSAWLNWAKATMTTTSITGKCCPAVTT